ncbi:uncharacterized protein PHACADRAFT_185820 [Phanerochaete carnosa HHB-10118-sp]|uniref:Uncharacterized protein n=1 Tax=Phanerochaete carnosa (strain HHB-10118-sp) TaxID=650164 RepID=K5USW4_PHACS|nr:uncharacterized protein PHACADRAFT_185820 [Phanerochaete carnosa HHB-10118-sp]EKM53031.1 hypothetical protein PHACADRAFT_185820 [Phanerochaete carnosa HHB-10118-sp]
MSRLAFSLETPNSTEMSEHASLCSSANARPIIGGADTRTTEANSSRASISPAPCGPVGLPLSSALAAFSESGEAAGLVLEQKLSRSRSLPSLLSILCTREATSRGYWFVVGKKYGARRERQPCTSSKVMFGIRGTTQPRVDIEHFIYGSDIREIIRSFVFIRVEGELREEGVTTLYAANFAIRSGCIVFNSQGPHTILPLPLGSFLKAALGKFLRSALGPPTSIATMSRWSRGSGLLMTTCCRSTL